MVMLWSFRGGFGRLDPFAFGSAEDYGCSS